MSAELVPMDNGETLPGLLREDRYILPAALSFERWQEIGSTLQQMHRSINWWIGDWLAYGEDNFGEDAYQAIQAVTGRGDDSINQTVWIAKSFPPHLRIDGVSWSHHRAVADLDPVERTELLTTAAREHWSTRVLRDEVERREQAIRLEATGAVSEPVCAADAPLSLDDLLPEWRDRAYGSGQPMGYLQALIDTGSEACFTRWVE